jgi:hypothetical protein
MRPRYLAIMNTTRTAWTSWFGAAALLLALAGMTGIAFAGWLEHAPGILTIQL